MKTSNDRLNRGVKFARPGRPSLLACVLLICLTPQASSAYDNDTHFWLTYYLAVKAGYSHTQATQIASANVSVDFDKHTEPLTPRFDSWKDWFQPQSHFQFIRGQFHALPLRADFFNREWWNPTRLATEGELLKRVNEKVADRRKKFWEATVSERRNPGVFLHYLQDTYAHSGFTSYIGHAGYYYVDFLDSDRAKAEQMAFDTLKHLVVFREALAADGKDLKNLRNPETLMIEDLFPPEVVAQIRDAVKEFCQANPSEGVRPNILVEDWDNLDESDKSNYKVPPPIYACSITHIKKNGPAPDSSKARKVVQGLLGLQESETPHIWLYNLNSLGQPSDRRAKRALVYVLYKSTKKVFTANDETKNTVRREVRVNGKRQCLSFDVAAGNPPVDPFSCK
jgi:hypothetical protein